MSAYRHILEAAADACGATADARASTDLYGERPPSRCVEVAGWVRKLTKEHFTPLWRGLGAASGQQNASYHFYYAAAVERT